MYEWYKSRVDRALEDLRARFLNLDIPLISFVPNATGLSEEQIAERLSDIIFFAMRRAGDFPEKHHEPVWRWLRMSIYCLLTTCRESDRTSCSLVKIAGLNAEEWHVLACEHAPAAWIEDLSDLSAYQEDLQKALWQLAGGRTADYTVLKELELSWE